MAFPAGRSLPGTGTKFHESVPRPHPFAPNRKPLKSLAFAMAHGRGRNHVSAQALHCVWTVTLPKVGTRKAQPSDASFFSYNSRESLRDWGPMPKEQARKLAEHRAIPGQTDHAKLGPEQINDPLILNLLSIVSRAKTLISKGTTCIGNVG